MSVHVDVWDESGTRCREDGCKADAVVWLQRPPLPTDYYCKADGRSRVLRHRRWRHIIEITPAAAKLLEVDG